MTTGTGNAEMGELAESMKAFREQSRERKQSNRERSTQLLLENGIKFQSRNDGLHLMIDTPAGRVNFYPSTGLYNGVLDGRGVFTLLDELKRLKMVQTAKKKEEKKEGEKKMKIVLRQKSKMFGTETWIPMEFYSGEHTLAEIVQHVLEKYEGLTSKIISEKEVELLKDDVVIGKLTVENE